MEHPNCLNLICWNANGLQSRKNELEVFLHQNSIDVALISETHLTSTVNTPKICNYDVYLANHPSGQARGGSAVIIKKSLHHYDVGVFITTSIQSSVVAINFNNHTVHLSSIYCPPRVIPDKETFLTLFRHLGHNFILGGDLNSKHPIWGSRITSQRGRALHQAIVEYNCRAIPPDGPTHWPVDHSKRPDVIDFFICKGIPDDYISSYTITELTSDHIPVMCIISNMQPTTSAPRSIVNRSTDWNLFRELVDSQLDLNVSLKSTDELELQADRFTEILQQCARQCTTYKTLTPSATIYPTFICNLVRSRRRARKSWQRNRTTENRQIFNRLSRETSYAINQWKNDTFQSYLSELAPSKEAGYSLWKAAKRIRRPPPERSPLKKEDGTWTRNERERAELFAQHYAETFQTNNILSDIDPTPLPPDEGHIKPTSPLEVAGLIDKLVLHKSPGLDDIPTIIYRELPRRGIVYITRLFNAALRMRHIPLSWKSAKMIVILKPGKPPEDPSSYRPISLLPIIAKLFEKVVLSRIQTIIIRKKMLPDIQFGFRQKHATIEQIHRVVHSISQALENKEYAPTAFLDVSSAFDKVWHEGLLHKISPHFPAPLSLLLSSYLSRRSFQVFTGSEHSGIHPIAAGVPQGSVLGPTLFLLYTMDIPQARNVTTALFADDTAVTSCNVNYDTAVSNLQLAINQISTWAARWKIKLNQLKSVRVDFTLRPHHYTPTIIEGTPIPIASHARYLGLHLDCKLNWQEHVRAKRDLLNMQFDRFHWLIGRRSNLSLASKKLIYSTIFKPVWTYGCELWGTTRDSNRLIIERFQNKFMRTITKAPFYVTNDQLRNDLELDSISETIRKKSTRYVQRLHDHTNTEAIQLLDDQNDTRRLRRRHPLDLVD